MSMLRKSIVCVCILFLCTVSAFSDDKTDSEKPASEKKSASTVSIEQALKTSYVKDKEQNTEIIRFSGNVILSVIKENKKTLIRAETVNFDRKRDVLFASGDVVVERYVDGKLTETISAETVLFNTVTLEGVFTQGRAVQKQQESLKLSEGSSLIVASELFAKDRSDAVAFKKGMITFCGDENPHWKIKAHRIWLLPGNEFAFANALLYVGVVPVMYFPFFYYPKDELVFNPSFGYRPREGYFIQTTTYIMGRKPLESDDTDSKGFNFMKPSSLKKQQLDGLILRNLDSDDVMPPYFLKFMADYYTTLGAMVGIAGEFKPKTAVNNLSFNIRIGFSNTVYPVSGYTQYISYSAQKQQHADFGRFFGFRFPFRYAASFKTAVQKNGFSLSASLPLYSDPRFDRDFGDRKESMDWIDFFLKGAFSGAGKTGEAAPVQSSSNISNISSYTWNVSGSYTPDVPALRPYLENMSLSSFGSSVVFSPQKADIAEFDGQADRYEHSPNKDFFYPVQIKPLALSLSFSGTLINVPSQKKAAEKPDAEKNAALQDMQNNMSVPELFAQDLKKEQQKNADGEDTVSAEKTDLFKTSALPDVPLSPPSPVHTQPFSYKLTYALKPDFSTLLTYSPRRGSLSGTAAPDFFIQDPKASEFFLKTPLDITGNLSWYGNLFSLENSLSFFPQYLTHPVLSSLYTASERERIIVNDYAARKIDIDNKNALTVKPLLFSPVFQDSSLSWNTGVRLLRTSFSGTADNPVWKYSGPQWDTKTLTTHNLSFVFSAKEGGFTQRLSFQANLPPLLESYTGNLQFIFPFADLSLAGGYKKRENPRPEWYFAPLVQTAALTFFKEKKDGSDNKNKLTLAQKFEYDINEKHPERFNAGASWRGVRFSYEMLYGYSYRLDASRGWITSERKHFLPYTFTFQADVSNAEFKNRKNTVYIKPALSSVLTWNIVKPTDSYFSFMPSFTFKINNFLNLTFSAESRNKELLRYMQKPLGFTPEIPGERNIFIDLFNSFMFWDEPKRLSSGFKIKHINIKLEHDLHDWILNSEFKIEPRIITGSGGLKRYDYKPYFSFSVQWKPLRGIKTVIRDEYGDFVLNPAK